MMSYCNINMIIFGIKLIIKLLFLLTLKESLVVLIKK